MVSEEPHNSHGWFASCLKDLEELVEVNFTTNKMRSMSLPITSNVPQGYILG